MEEPGIAMPKFIKGSRIAKLSWNTEDSEARSHQSRGGRRRRSGGARTSQGVSVRSLQDGENSPPAGGRAGDKQFAKMAGRAMLTIVRAGASWPAEIGYGVRIDRLEPSNSRHVPPVRGRLRSRIQSFARESSRARDSLDRRGKMSGISLDEHEAWWFFRIVRRPRAPQIDRRCRLMETKEREEALCRQPAF